MQLKKPFTALLAAVLAASLMLSLTGCGRAAPSDTALSDDASSADASFTGIARSDAYPDAHVLQLEGDRASLDGETLEEYDTVWRADPSLPAPQVTGALPETLPAAYLAHDIIYYPALPEDAFEKTDYDGEQEWVTHFTADGLQDYLFGTLPVRGETLPTDMMHTAEEAYANPVLHITQPGSYLIEGTFQGQLFFDLGEEAFADPAASVTVILNGADVTCTVAPAIVFYNVYECDNDWEDREDYSDVTDLTDAGVKIILADGTENRFSGCNVYRLLKPEYKKNSTAVQKKLWKTDGAFYSFVSAVIDGESCGTGILNILGTTFEGLDSELHLTVDGGYIHIFSQDDGINVNEDHVSVFTLNGGHLTIFAALGTEGDVIDSNGYIRVNGGVLAGTSRSPSDELLDSEDGTYLSEEATVFSGGSTAVGRQDGMGGMPPDIRQRQPGEMPGERDGRPDEMPEMPDSWNSPSGEMPQPPEKPDDLPGDPPTAPDAQTP